MRRSIDVLILLLFVAIQGNAQILPALSPEMYPPVGNATIDGECMTLAEEYEEDKVGAVWFKEKLNLTNPFDIRVRMNFGDIYVFNENEKEWMNSDLSGWGDCGADGIAFVLQQESESAGRKGEGIGYKGVRPSVAVEFDTYYNSSADPVYNHIAIAKNGDYKHTTGYTAGNQYSQGTIKPDALITDAVGTNPATDFLADGEFHDVRVTWDPITQTLMVWLDCNLKLTLTEDIIQTIFKNDPEVFFGFSSATGSCSNTHQVCIPPIAPQLIPLPDQSICAGNSVTVTAELDKDAPGATFNWYPILGGDESTISSPNTATTDLSPMQTTTYVVEVRPSCYDDDPPVYDTIRISAEGILEAGNLKEKCGTDNLFYTVEFFVNGADINSLQITGNSGTITDGALIKFVSDPIPQGTAYSFTIVDANVCNPNEVTGTYSCPTDCIGAVATTNDDSKVCSNAEYKILNADTTNAIDVYWTHNGGGTLLDDKSLTPIYLPDSSDEGNQVLLILTAMGDTTGGKICPSDTASVVLDITAAPKADAGEGGAICDGTAFELSEASAENYTSILWTHNGNGTLINETTENPEYTSVSKDLNQLITISMLVNGDSLCKRVKDSIVVEVTGSASAFAGLDSVACINGAFQFTNATASGVSNMIWRHSGLGELSDSTVLLPTYTPELGDTANPVQFILWADAPDPCIDGFDTFNLEVVKPPIIEAGIGGITCVNGEVTISGASVSGADSISWIHDGAGELIDIETMSPTYIADSADAGKTVLLSVIAWAAFPCSGISDDVAIDVKEKSTAFAGTDQTICAMGSYLLADASASNYTSLSWTHNGDGELSYEQTLTPIYTPDSSEAGDTITLKLVTTSLVPCQSDSSEVNLILIELPEVNAGDDGEICLNGTYQVMNAEVGNTSDFIWQVVPGTGKGIIQNPTTINPVYESDVRDAGKTVTLRLTVQGDAPCMQWYDELNLEIKMPALVEAGSKTRACITSSVAIDDAFVQNASKVWWTHNGAGTIENDSILVPVYQPDSLDIGKFVVLTLNALSEAPCEDTIRDQVKIRIVGNPTATAGDPSSICYLDDFEFTTASVENATHLEWTHNGNGYLSNENHEKASYLAIESDTGKTIEFTLIAYAYAPCFQNDTSIVEVEVVAPPAVYLNFAGRVCVKDSLQLRAKPAMNYDRLEWFHTGEGSINVGTNTAEPYYQSVMEDAGDSILVSVVAHPMTPCLSPDTSSVYIHIDSIPEFSLDTLEICFGSTIGISPSPESAYEFYADESENELLNVGSVLFVEPRETTSYYVRPSRGCKVPNEEAVVVVHPMPVASFELEPERLSFEGEEITILNSSESAFTGTWYLGDSSALYTSQDSILKMYNDIVPGTDKYDIKLVVETEFGCLDSLTVPLPIDLIWTFFVPNGFSPNGDGINDSFRGKGMGIKELEMYIFNRWGDIVYYTEDQMSSWDGRDHIFDNKTLISTPDIDKSDTFVYKITILNVLGEKHIFRGKVNLIK